MSNHAFLSASSSHRWLACPPSAKLCAEAADAPTAYAQEGTDCHELCAYLVEKALGIETEDPTPHLTYYSGEMQNCADEYAAFVLESIESAKAYCKDPVVMIEQRLDFSRWVPDGFGTGDCVIVADEQLHIIDYKHGLGILVSAEENSQMMCYALGALESFDGIYEIETIKMTIFQPRRGNVSTYTISKDGLLSWASSDLAPTAKLAMEGGGEFAAGDHCQFCKVKAVCKKRAEENMALAKYEFREPALLTSDEIAEILPQLDELKSWMSDVKSYALQKAQSGTHFKGFKVVEGRSVRHYTDETEVAKAVSSAGYDPYEKKLLGITAMTSLLGKKTFNELLGGLIYKPPGAPVLVPETDSRPEMNTAINDFKDEKEN